MADKNFKVKNGIDVTEIVTAAGFNGPLTGNASSASKWETARTLTVSGDISGSSTFDGSSGITLSLTLPTMSGITGGTTYGSSTSVPVITVDSKGRITSASSTPISSSLAFVGEVTGTGAVGSNTTLSLSNTGVTAGVYRSVTVDVKGRITAGTNPTTLTGYGITDLSAVTYSAKISPAGTGARFVLPVGTNYYAT